MGFYRSAFQGWTVARFALCSLLLLVAVVFAGSPLVTEQASAAACRPSVAVTFSNETRVGGEAVSATVTVTANAATGGAPDTLTRIAFTNDPEVSLSTAYGPACGRSYPLSSRFVGDMAQLAQTFAGSGPLYVTLFTEFQTYPCADNTWVGSENYYRALKDQYLAALAAFRQHAPNAKVSIGWGGWQARWDNPAQGSGRSLFPRFADVMDASDFQSFQAMQSDTNVQDVRDMTSILGAYGPVMLAHYKPDNGSCPAATADLTTMLTDAYLRDVIEDGLFAWSFMDDGIVTCSSQLLTFVRSAVTTYAR